MVDSAKSILLSLMDTGKTYRNVSLIRKAMIYVVYDEDGDTCIKKYLPSAVFETAAFESLVDRVLKE